MCFLPSWENTRSRRPLSNVSRDLSTFKYRHIKLVLFTQAEHFGFTTNREEVVSLLKNQLKLYFFVI